MQSFFHVFMHWVAFLSDHNRASIDFPRIDIVMNIHIALATATWFLVNTWIRCGSLAGTHTPVPLDARSQPNSRTELWSLPLDSFNFCLVIGMFSLLSIILLYIGSRTVHLLLWQCVAHIYIHAVLYQQHEVARRSGSTDRLETQTHIESPR